MPTTVLETSYEAVADDFSLNRAKASEKYSNTLVKITVTMFSNGDRLSVQEPVLISMADDQDNQLKEISRGQKMNLICLATDTYSFTECKLAK